MAKGMTVPPSWPQNWFTLRIRSRTRMSDSTPMHRRPMPTSATPTVTIVGFSLPGLYVSDVCSLLGALSEGSSPPTDPGSCPDGGCLVPASVPALFLSENPANPAPCRGSTTD